VATVNKLSLRPIYWHGEGVKLIDQTLLPLDEVWLELSDYREVIAAIKEMRIRGAPAIGVAGAYAVALAAMEISNAHPGELLPRLERAAHEIEGARPTGANLGWAVRRMLTVARLGGSDRDTIASLIDEATRIQDEDEAANRRMGRLGADLIGPGTAVLTHCNTGALATGGYGTALGVIRTAWADGRISRVFATETRPFLQGARLTAWELVQANIEVTIIPDSAAGQLMRSDQVQAVIVGADRIAANGDVANKIGTYSLAVLARENGVPFYVAAPTGTVDMGLSTGDTILIEERSEKEVTHINGVQVAPDGARAFNPAFDVTPHRYLTAIITERGLVREPFGPGLSQILEVPVG